MSVFIYVQTTWVLGAAITLPNTGVFTAWELVAVVPNGANAIGFWRRELVLPK